VHLVWRIYRGRSAASGLYPLPRLSGGVMAVRQIRPFEGPLVRMTCPECHERWDCWTDSEGWAEDPRDLRCGECRCLAEPIEDDD
jgi:hypothetical protein